MSKELRQLLGLEKPNIYFVNTMYVPPKSPAVNYFPFETPDLSEVVIAGEWEPTKFVEIKKFENDKLIHNYVWKKDKNGYLYVYDKITKKKYHDSKYKYKVMEESGFIVREEQ